MSIREVLPHLITTALLACVPFLGISNAALNFLIVVLITALAAQNRTDLLAFLESLTDQDLLHDPQFSNPR